MNRRIPLAPAEGWPTVGLAILLCLTLAWSLDDARWVLGRIEYLDFLQWMVLGGVLAGYWFRRRSAGFPSGGGSGMVPA